MTPATTPLREIAKVIRSKNAGPFEITLDIVFKTKEDFESVHAIPSFWRCCQTTKLH